MRFIGLEFKESSPDNVVDKFAGQIPEIRRVVVPLFPTFKVEAGAVRPRRPFPCTRILEVSFQSQHPFYGNSQSWKDSRLLPENE